MAAATSATVTATESGLQDLAKRHLWMHFTRHGAYDDADVPIVVRGEGPYVWDEKGNRYLDGLSALFCVNAGHGLTELGDAAAKQVAELDFYTLWSYAHPRAIELAGTHRVAGTRRPEPRLLHQQRIRGRGVRDQARPRLSPAHRLPAQDQVHHP